MRTARDAPFHLMVDIRAKHECTGRYSGDADGGDWGRMVKIALQGLSKVIHKWLGL